MRPGLPGLVVSTYFIQAYVALFFLYPLALTQRGVPLSATGLTLSLFYLATTLARPIGGLATERMGAKRTLLLAGVGLVLTGLPFPLLEGTALLGLRFGQGLAYGLYMVALTALQARIVPPEARGKDYAVISVGYVLPQLTVLPLSEALILSGRIETYEWLVPLLAVASLAAVFPLPGTRGGGEARAPWGTFRELFHLPSIGPLLAVQFLFALVNAAALQYLPAILNGRGARASAFIVSVALSALMTRLFGRGLMATRPRRAILSGACVLWMGVLMLAALTVRGTGEALLCGALYGLGMGWGFPVILALVPDLTPPGLRPKGVAAAFFALDMGWILAPLLVGGLAGVGGGDAGPSAIAAAGVLGGVGLLWAWRKTFLHPASGGGRGPSKRL